MKHWLCRWGAFGLAALMLLAGCAAGGAASDTASNTVEYVRTEEFGMQGVASPVAPGAAADGALAVPSPSPMESEVQPRKQVQYVDLTLETLEFDQSLSQLLALVQEAGGYVESQQVSGQSMTDSTRYQERRATIQARIPAEQLEEVVQAAGQLCNQTGIDRRMQDITDSYYDAQARLTNMQLQEQRLRELLEQAQQLEDIIALEAQLAEVRSQIESLTAQLARMDGQVSYSYLDVQLREVSQLRLLESAPRTLGEKVQAAFGRSGEKIAQALEDILLFIIADLPTLLIYITLWLGVFWVVRAIWRRLFGGQLLARWKEKRRLAKQPPAAPAAMQQPEKAPGENQQ